jgi:hypothetical protein
MSVASPLITLRTVQESGAYSSYLRRASFFFDNDISLSLIVAVPPGDFPAPSTGDLPALRPGDMVALPPGNPPTVKQNAYD